MAPTRLVGCGVPESCDGIGLSRRADGIKKTIKKTTRAGLAVCLSFDTKIVAVDFLFVCVERYEFGVLEVASVGKDGDKVGRGCKE